MTADSRQTLVGRYALHFTSLPALAGGRPSGGPSAGEMPVIPWPDLHGAFIEAASAVSAQVLREAEHAATLETGGGQ